MKQLLLIAFVIVSGVVACTQPYEAAEETKGSLVPSEATNGEEEQVTELAPITIGPYKVSANYEGPLADGHFNLHVTGPEFAAIRQWVGPEDASGVLVSKAEVMPDHIHAGVEMPDPIPADARFWIEIETPDGERLRGSMPLLK